MKRNLLSKLTALSAALLLGGLSGYAQTSDTSKVCTGQGVTLTAPDPPASTTYDYFWFDNQNTTPIATSKSLVVSSGTLANVSSAPVQHIYKLVVVQTGGATCPSDTMYKSIIVYPNLSNSVASEHPFYCTGTPVDIELTATTQAGSPAAAASTLALTSGTYGTLTYTWGGTGVTASATNTTIIPAAQIANLSLGANAFDATASYVDALSAGTTITTCHSSNGVGSVTINNAPAINGTNVTTTYQ